MDMLVLIISILVSLIPLIVLYKWLRTKGEDEKYKKVCKKAFVSGIISVFPILLVSGILFIIGKVSMFEKINPLMYQAYYKFIALAFGEELVKFLAFKIKKIDCYAILFSL